MGESDEVLEEIEIEDNSFSYYEEDTENLIFEPSVGNLRLHRVFAILISAKWRKELQIVTDYGCGEFGLFKYIYRFLNLRKINLVDIDETVLRKGLPRLNVLDHHYLNRRFNPLKVAVFEGSISDPDERILNSDAVIGIEIIEHLYPDTLEAVPYVIFHSVKPKIVIFSTPNADFNEVFPKFKKFRHLDHKFEWTREQFESWARNITLRFPRYTVSFFGVGKHPDGTTSLGYCTQFALFVRRDIMDLPYHDLVLPCSEGDAKYSYTEKNKGIVGQCHKCSQMKPFGICTYLTKSKKFECEGENDLNIYREIYSKDFKYRQDDTRSDEQRLLEIMMRNMQNNAPNFEGLYSIPLYKIIDTQIDGQLISEKEAGDILRRNGFVVNHDLIEYNSGWKWKQCVEFTVPKNSLYFESSSESEDEF